MLLRICSHTYAEIISAIPPEFAYSLHKLVGMAVSVRIRGEAFLSADGIAPEGKHILYAHESEVVQVAHYLIRRMSAAYDVGNHLQVEFTHYRPADRHLAHPVPHKMPGEGTVSIAHEFIFIPVTGDVHISRGKLHERANGLYKFSLAHSLERRYYLQGGEGAGGTVYYVYYFHADFVFSLLLTCRRQARAGVRGIWWLPFR